jgi:adenosylmethionine-8-amino-7-oxononanoate aminotransferase
LNIIVIKLVNYLLLKSLKPEKMDPKEIIENMFCNDPNVPILLITKTDGVYFYESNGGKILDASGGPMACNIGHGRKEIAEVAKKSLENLSYVLPVFASEARIRLSKRVKTFLPDEINRTYFCSGGSEANEAAIKLARQFHVLSGRESKYKVISRKLSYHGMTLATLSLSGIRQHRRDFIPLLWKNPPIEPCFCYRCPFQKTYPECRMECAYDLEKTILQEDPDSVSAFIAEPIVATAAGAVVPPDEYFPIIREICDKYDVVFIADEIVTGFGRTGKNMGMDHFSVIPDIYVFAKGVSGGYAPLAGMAVRNHITSLFHEKGAEFRHLYTYSANPLSCAIGDEVLRIIMEEKLIERVNNLEVYLSDKLNTLKSLPIVGDIRGKGLLWAIEFVWDKDTKDPFPVEYKLKMQIIMACLTKGIFFYPGYYENELGRGDHIMISPPFIISEEEIDHCINILSTTIDALSQKVFEN